MVNSYLMTTTGKEDPRFEDLYLFHGKSAYQAAVEQGFTGTEVEWIASLMNVEFNEKAKFQYKNQWLLYVATDLNHIYRYNAETNEYIQVGVPLGETSITAYRGDRGKIAYDHSQSDHDYLHRNGGTMNGDISTMNLIPKTDKIYDLGSMNKTYVNTYTKALQIRDGGGGTTYGRIVFKTNTENSDGYGYTSLVLGTNKATGAGNAYGFIDIYGKNTGYTRLLPSYDGTTQIILNFPKESGTIARIEDNVASATILKNTRTFYISDYSTANTGPGSEFNGSSNCTIKLPDTIKAIKFICTTLDNTTANIGTANVTTLNVSGNSALKGTLSVTGASTFAGTVTITKATDASGTANNSPALIVGGTATTEHLEIDSNEIQAKTNGTSVALLYLNADGGNVVIGTGGLTMNGNITSKSMIPDKDISYDLGTSGKAYANIWGSNLKINSGGYNYGVFYMPTLGTTSVNGEGRLVLGNNIATGNAGNSFGRLLLYGTNTGYTLITPGNNTTSNASLTLPSKGGTIARVEDNVASATILKTSRNFYVADNSATNTGPASSFNGSDNCTIKLPDTIKATSFVGALTGNASTATTLQTARNINGTSFNGSANITTALWGTARDFTIGLTKKSVNGSQAMTWTLNEIGAVEVAGDIMTGNLQVGNTIANGYRLITTTGDSNVYISATGGWARGTHYYHGDGTYLGGIGMLGNAKTATLVYIGGDHSAPWASVTPAGLFTTTTVKATTGNITTVNATTINATNATMSGTTKTATLNVTGTGTIGTLSVTNNATVTKNLTVGGTMKSTAIDAKYIELTHSTPYIDFHFNNTTTDYTSRIIESASGTLSINGVTITTDKVVTATTFSGALSGNASTATTLQTARNINVSDYSGTNAGAAVSFNGSKAITLKLPDTIKATSFVGALTGNASTATTLQTARNINGTSFNGSANITTALWGTARNIYIADATSTNTGTAVSVNGSKNVTLLLPATIKASLSGNASTASKLATARTITLTGSVTGSVSFDGSGNVSIATTTNHTHSYLPLSGGTLTGNLTTKHIYAAADSTYDIGTNTVRFRNIYGDNFYGVFAGYTLAAACARGVKSASGATDSGWGTNNNYVPDMSFIAYWNGAYSSSGASNLAYCNRGAFGTIVTMGSGDYLKVNGTNSMTGNLNMGGKRIHTIAGTYTSTAANRFSNSALEIRENGLVGSAQSDIGYAPTIGFHWGGRIAATLAFGSDGTFNFINQAGTGYSALRAGAITGDKVYNAVWNDYAEWYEREDLDEYFEAGDIVTWHESGVKKTTKSMDNLVVGVYSDTYGHIIGGEALDNMEDNIEKYIPVGVSGRVNVKVIGTVNRGDLIVSSDIPGIGIAIPSNLPHSGCVVGKALQYKGDNGLGKVKIQIMLA